MRQLFDPFTKYREKIRDALGIKEIRDAPKTLLEYLGEKTGLGAFRFLVIWFIGFFFLVDVILPLLTIGKPEPLLPSVKNYIVYLGFPWATLWFYCIYLIFYYKTTYLETIKKLSDENKIGEQEYKKLKKQLLPPIARRIVVIGISFTLLVLLIRNTYIVYCTEPFILWGHVTLEEIGREKSLLALIYMFLHYIPGCLVQVLIISDLFVIMHRFLSLAKELSNTLNVDVLSSDRRGGLGSIGELYFKVSIGYFVALLLFISLVFFIHRYPLKHPWLSFFIILAASLFGLFFFIYPQESIHSTLEKKKEECIQEISNNLKKLHVHELKTDLYDSVSSLRLMVLRNEIDKMSTYTFSKEQLIKIFIGVLTNIVSISLVTVISHSL